MLRLRATLTVVGVLTTVIPFAATGQTFSELYDFSSGSASVSQPVGAPFITAAGAVYGVSYNGGASSCMLIESVCGTFFKLTPPVANGDPWAESTLYEFLGTTDGGAPNANPLYIGGSFYGTTYGGGVATPGVNNGTAYEMVPSLSGFIHNVIYTFMGGSDGSRPTFLTVLNGTIYGITNFGGRRNAGIVFELSPSGAGQPFTETVIHTFNGTTEGAVPQYIVAHQGSLFVSLSNAGAYGNGTIVQLTPPTGAGLVWTTSVIFSFGGSASSAINPEGIGFGSDGLYGTALAGGGGLCTEGALIGCGEIFKLTPPLSGTTWTYTPIYTFGGGTDSGAPYAPPVFDNAGHIYVSSTGTAVAPISFGAVLRLTPHSGSFTPLVLYTFTGTYGSDPAGMLSFGPVGGIYGFATFGGNSTNGTTYGIIP